MAITLVQSAALGASTGATSQQTAAFAAQPTVGNYLVAWSWGWSGTVRTGPPQATTFTDTGGNAWTIPTGASQGISADLWGCVGWAKVATAGASFKVTSTPNVGVATGTSIMVVAAEFAGVLGASPQDGNGAGTTGTTGVPAPGSLAFTTGDLVAALAVTDQPTYDSFGYATPSGFTRSGYQNDGSTFEVGEGIYALSGTTPTNPAWKTGTVKWVAMQFALKPASGATGPAARLLVYPQAVRRSYSW